MSKADAERMTPVQVRLPRQDADDLLHLAHRTGLSRRALLRRLVDDTLAQARAEGLLDD